MTAPYGLLGSPWLATRAKAKDPAGALVVHSVTCSAPAAPDCPPEPFTAAASADEVKVREFVARVPHMSLCPTCLPEEREEEKTNA